MDFIALSTFVTVAERRSFSLAAEDLFTTQPAISKRIAALERDLGARLIDRLARGIRLTEAGETFLASARGLLDDAERAREAVRSLGDRPSGRLRLATSHHVGIHRLPPILRIFVAAHPDVELDLVFMDSEQACEAVADGALELAIVTLPDRSPTGGAARLDTRLVWPDPLVLVCAADHPLAHRTSLTPSVLAEHRAVLPGRGTVTRRILLDALAPHDVPIVTALETNYLETIKMLVSVGLGWSVLPAPMLDDSVVELPMPELTMLRRLGVVTRRGRTLGRAACALVAALPDDREDRDGSTSDDEYRGAETNFANSADRAPAH